MRDLQRDKFVTLAKDAIKALTAISSQYSGKNLSKIPKEYRKYTTSYIDSILIGLGNGKYAEYKSLVDNLTQLKQYALTKEKLAKYRLFENAEMAMSDVHKIVKYSSDIQQLFSVQDNLEDWVKAKLNHACDYVATVRDYLKFYRNEKEAGTPLNQIDEKWTNKYKKSIDCSNPKGFSQKAHCRARKLRQAGQSTSSKPVREIYKEITNQLLKEFNSSMAMGALKQIHNDAKELESMLQPDTQLEDWVKAKLNLAGEYLDDIYHHLDHFGPEGRTLDEAHKEYGSYKKLWFTPSGQVVDVGRSHEEWIIKNDKSIKPGATLVHTYDNAVKAGYVRGIYDFENKFLTLSNIPNYDLLVSNISGIVKKKIENFITDKNIKHVASGKGRLINDFDKSIVDEPEPDMSMVSEVKDHQKLGEGWKDLVAAAAIGASTLGGVSGLQAKPIKVSKQLVPINKPAITQTVVTKPSNISFDQSFVDYIKRVENAGKTGYNKQKKLWFPHESFEGGSDTIGYGHKIQKGEDFSKGITDAQAEVLLKRDLEKAKNIVNKEVGGRQLSKKQMEMFVDFVFNMGTLNKFPKFTEFALKNDLQGMKAQYKRFAGGKELKGRNSAFLQRFLTEYFGFNYYF